MYLRNHGGSELVASRFTRSFVRSVQQVDDDVFSSYLSVSSQQDDTEISIRAKHELTNDMMKRVWSEDQRYSKSKNRWFTCEVWAHDGLFWLIGFSQTRLAGAPPRLREQFWSLRGRPMRIMPKMSPRWSGARKTRTKTAVPAVTVGDAIG